MLKIKNISKSFDKTIVLNNISFNVEKGEVISIIGGSGSGKSTLLRLIDRLDSVNDGEILFNDESIENIKDYHQKVGMVFQQFNLYPHLTAIENIVLTPIKLKIMDKSTAFTKAKELLESVGLSDKKDSYPRSLSGGEKQRVAILRTLIMNPELILFDEPTSALDPKMTNDVLELIKSLIPLGITIIIVSHELSFVRDVSNRVIFISEGRIESDSSSYDTFNSPKSEKLVKFIGNMN